jgi:hypothetical protein
VERKTLFIYTFYTQLFIVFMIFLKLWLFPYLVWKMLGTSAGAAIVLDLTALMMGVGCALGMGALGYAQAKYLRQKTRTMWFAFLHMVFLHAPLILFLFYKFFYGAAWNNALLLWLSGWLSVITHPMILVGFYGSWVDWLGLLFLGSFYLLGVWVFLDEHPLLDKRLFQYK